MVQIQPQHFKRSGKALIHFFSQSTPPQKTQVFLRHLTCILFLKMSVYVKTINEYWSFDWATYTPVGKTGIAEYDLLASYYKHFLPTVLPFAAVLGYWFLSDPICGIIRSLLNGAEVKGKDGKPVKNGFDRALSLLTIIHSAALTVYSGWTCYNTYRIMSAVWNAYRQDGLGVWDTFMAMSCDGNGKLWNDANLGYWVTHFYISKVRSDAVQYSAAQCSVCHIGA